MSQDRRILTRACLASVVLVILAAMPGIGSDETPRRKLIEKARRFVKQLASGDVDQAVSQFDAKMSEVLPPDNLRALWRNLESQAGSFKSMGEARVSRAGGFDTVYLDMAFEQHALRFKIVFDKSERISGFWVEPAASTTGPSAAPAAYKPPSYDKPDRYSEERVSFGEDPWIAKGILTLPNGVERAPAVVLVHGSGPHDEDETIGVNKPFRDLATGLSSNGIAVLRYQKRTHAYQLRLAAEGRISVREEVVDDALAALKFVRAHPRVDPARVFVVGHSLGATLGPQIAHEDGKVAGAVLLAGTARDLTDVLLDQLGYIASLPLPNQAQNQKMYDETLATLMKVRNGELGDDATVLNVPVTYWKELSTAAERSLEVARGLSCRLLIVNGGRDYQVTKKDYDLYRRELAARSNVSFKWFKNCNHLFFAGESMSTPQEYEKAGHVDEAVIKYLVKWIAKSK